MRRRNNLAALFMALGGALLAFSPSAHALTIGDTHSLGSVDYAIPSGDTARRAYVNHLIGMALGTTDQANGQTYFRSNNSFGQLPQALMAGRTSGNLPVINLGAGGVYTYLFARYGGPNSTSQVWYVGNLNGVITIPTFAGRYALKGWTLFRAGGQGVPDGGTTVMLLGAALVALGITRRFLKI